MNNFSLEDLMKLARASESKNGEDLLSAVQNKLPSDKMSEIKKVMSDKKALEDLLKTEQAQRLMQMLKNNK